jgi:tetratricopeptide (TPR) repeat protein
LARKGLALDPTDALVVLSAALAVAYSEGVRAGLDLVEKAITLNPNLALAYRMGGNFNGYLGEVDHAVEYLRRAERLNPLANSIFPNEGWTIAFFGVGDLEAVVDATARVLREHPNSGPVLRYRAASLALLGRIEEARKVVAHLLEARPNYSISEVRRHHEFDLNNPFKTPSVTEALYRGLRLAGLPE